MARKPFAIVAVLIALTLAFSLSAFAQGTTSRVTGTVTDSSGAAVAGATVTLTNEGTNISRTTETGESGNYVFDLVQPGTYSVSVERAGFRKFISSKNPVQVNIPATVNVTLDVGDVTAVVSVEATAEQVQTGTSGNVGAVVDQRTIESVPIVAARGRNPLDLLNYQPGIVSGANTGGEVHVHGSRDRAFNFTLDGVDINESSAGGSNFTPLRPNPDSIQEFQVVTSNFTAELGRSSGAQVTFVTRSGTNDFRGNIFEFYQTPDLLANSYANNTLGFPRPQFIQHIYGGSFGGPLPNFGFGEGTKFFDLLKDRAFFFTNLQFLRQSQAQLVQRTVYTQDARNGIFRFVRNGRNAPAGTNTSTTFPSGAGVNTSGAPIYGPCPGSTPTAPCTDTYNVGTNPSGIGIDPVILASINLAPLPNDFTRGDGLNTAGYNFLAPTSEKQYDFVSKFDVKINDSNSFYVRWAQGKQDTLFDAGNSGQSPFPGLPATVNTFRDPKNLAINYRTSPNSTITNEFIYGYSKFDFFFGTDDPFVPFILNLVTDAGTNVKGNGRGVRVHQFVDNITFDLGRHIMKGGINFRLGQQADDRSEVAGGRIEGRITFDRTINSNFNAFALPSSGINSNDLNTLRSQINDYLGRVGVYNQAFVANENGSGWEPAGTRWKFAADYMEYDFYLQDTWKFRPNLTVDLGVRWEPKLSPTSGGLPVLRPNTSVVLGAAPSNTIRWEEGNMFKNDWNNLSPSVGFAWDPFKKGKTSVRMNYRLAYDRFGTQLFASALFQNAPGNNTVFPTNNNYGASGGLYRNITTIVPTGTPDQLRQPPAIGTLTQTVMDPDLVFPEIHSWFAGFQHEIWWKSVIEVNYIGKKGVHLFGGYDANQVDIFNNGFLNAFKDLRANRTVAGYQNAYFNTLLAGDSRISAADATATRMLIRLFPNEIGNGSVAALAGTLASGSLTAGQRVWQANSGNPFFFQRYPQFSVLNVLDSNDYSFYNALELIWKKRFANGVSFNIGYTLAKSKDTRSFDPLFTTVGRGTGQSASSTPFDNRDRSLNYALSDFDRRHALQAVYTAELPFGKGRRFMSNIPTALDWIIGGWQLAGTFNWASGRPFTVYSQANTISNAVVTPVNCSSCSPRMGEVFQFQGTNWFFTQEQLAGISNPEPGEMSNTGRNFFIGPQQFQTDASLSKKFRFNERFSFDLRVDAKNLTNSPSFANPNAVLGATAPLGRIRESVTNAARRIQLGARFNF